MNAIRALLSIAATIVLATTVVAPARATTDSFAPVFVTLHAVGGSGQSGRAVMREIGSEVVISGTVANESPTVLEPSYLRRGPCGTNAPIMRALGMVTRGVLGTMPLPGFTFARLRAMHASISISKSEKALGVIVSCGNI